MEFGASAIDTHQIRLALVQASLSGDNFAEKNRGCVLEAFQVILDDFHCKTQPELCPERCLLHHLFSMTCLYFGLCCEGLSETVQSHTLCLSGELLLQNFKNFKNSASSVSLNFVINSLISPDVVKHLVCTCGSTIVARPKLILPEIFTISILWDEKNMKDSEDLFKGMNEVINLQEIFEANNCDSKSEYELQSMVCYSRVAKHYISVVKNSRGKWAVVSDELKVSSSWGIVKFSLKLLGLAPVLLFYIRI